MKLKSAKALAAVIPFFAIGFASSAFADLSFMALL